MAMGESVSARLKPKGRAGYLAPGQSKTRRKSQGAPGGLRSSLRRAVVAAFSELGVGAAAPRVLASMTLRARMPGMLLKTIIFCNGGRQC